MRDPTRWDALRAADPSTPPEDPDGSLWTPESFHGAGTYIADVTDPYNPKEIARYFDNSPEFLESNDGMPDGHYAKFGGEDLPGYPQVWQERQIP